MVNLIHAKLHRPERGWDPISREYASGYASHAEATFDAGVLDFIESEIGSFDGLRVLDLGGGPGQYSVALAERGAQVVWHDISQTYKNISEQRAKARRVNVEFSIGYLEDAACFADAPFDLVFCQVAWKYCRNDQDFARLIHDLLKPGGAAYIASLTPAFERPSGFRTLQAFINRTLGFKLGHPAAPHGRVAQLFNNLPLDRMTVDYSSEESDIVLAVKRKSTAR